jgi:hypothetical protein
MNKVAIALNTKDKPEQVKRVMEKLFQPDKFDLWWYDGSVTPAGQRMNEQYNYKHHRANVLGSGDNAAVLALTEMLQQDYDYVGLCEDDILFTSPDWFERTMELFELGAQDGLAVGAVSARTYEDRVLTQRKSYAVMHNLGWGHVIFTREAALLTLKHYRSGWTTENRRVFAQLSGADIGKWWAFRGAENWFCSDWGNDAVLASYGLASLALTPTLVEMINQNPPLEEQQLRLVKRTADMHRDDRVFDTFKQTTAQIRAKLLKVDARPVFFRLDEGGYIYFSHQLAALRARFKGEWFMRHNLGFGPFGWQAGESASLSLEVAGPIDVLVGGGDTGGSCMVRDLNSGYEVEPKVEPAKIGGQLFMACVVPANVSWRRVVVDKISPGLVIYGIRTKETQPVDPGWVFDASQLPPAIAAKPLGEQAKVLEAAK